MFPDSVEKNSTQTPTSISQEEFTNHLFIPRTLRKALQILIKFPHVLCDRQHGMLTQKKKNDLPEMLSVLSRARNTETRKRKEKRNRCE